MLRTCSLRRGDKVKPVGDTKCSLTVLSVCIYTGNGTRQLGSVNTLPTSTRNPRESSGFSSGGPGRRVSCETLLPLIYLLKMEKVLGERQKPSHLHRNGVDGSGVPLRRGLMGVGGCSLNPLDSMTEDQKTNSARTSRTVI